MNLLAFDTETTKFSTFHGGKPFLATTFDGKNAKYYKINAKNDAIKAVLADKSTIKVGQNVKFDLLHLDSVGIPVLGEIHDTMIMSFLFEENTKHNLEFLAANYLGKKKLGDTVKAWLHKHGYTEKRQKEENRSFYELVPDEIMIPYALEDVVLTYELYYFFAEKLQSMDLWELYQQELALIPVLIRMQKNGLKIDMPYFLELQQKYIDKIAYLSDKLLNTINIPGFNLNSTQQLARWLKTSKQIVLPCTAKGSDSVDKHALKPYDNDPDVATLLDYRYAKKILSTYIEPYLELQVNGYLHADLMQCGAKSGRCSCAAPALQTLPKPDEDEPETYIIRRGFIPEEDYFNFYFDFSNMEVVMFVEYTNDEKMIKVLNNGLDFHQLNADKLGITRKKAKTFVFATLYGAGITKIAKMLGVSVEEARKIKKDYFRNFTEVDYFISDVTNKVTARGFIFNKYKRRRRLAKEKAYTAVNFLIQGSCADLVKEKMIKIDALLAPTKSKMLLMIHDELAIAIHKTELYLVPEIKKEMEDLGHVLKKVHLRVGTDYTNTNWADKQEYKC